MKKAAIVKQYALNAEGILSIEDNVVGIEHPDTGEIIELCALLSDFANRSIKLSVNYSEYYE